MLGSLKKINKYFASLNLSKEEMMIFFPKKVDKKIYEKLSDCWSNNHGMLTDSLIDYEFDLYAYYFCYRLLQRNLQTEELYLVLRTIGSLCDWCSGNEIQFTIPEVTTLLIGLFYRNHYNASMYFDDINPIIEKVKSNIAMEKVWLFLWI